MSIDATAILNAAAKRRRIDPAPRQIPLQVDLALLAVYDTNLLDEEAYKTDREEYLRSNTRDGLQTLINTVFNRPTTVNVDGIMASLPTESLTVLPREKPLPKPKPPTKWERFASQKGIISKSKKDRMEFDEEKQEWVPRFGYKGKNKAVDDQWLVEVPANKPADFDPRAEAKETRKANKLKNEAQRLRNQTQANAKNANEASRASRKSAVERDLASTRKSTASLGRFDKSLPGDERAHRGKRKFDANELGATTERERDAKILKSMAVGAGTGGKRADGEKGGLVNARKAIRAQGREGASRGRGGKQKPGSKRR